MTAFSRSNAKEVVMIILRRNGQQVNYQPEEFWYLCATQQILRTDEVLDWNGGSFLRADQFPDVQPYLPAPTIQEIIESLVGGAVTIGVGVLAMAGVAVLLDAVFGSDEPAPRRRRPSPNYEPLETWKKQLVRQRDREICNYCGEHASHGHVDHKTSRANGGSNLLRNLVWACSSCNCSKGRMNAPNFRRFIWTN
jgi:HNH endonuclease